MRIAYISYEYPPDTALGGISTYVQQAARLMATRGHSVEVFASSSLRVGPSEDAQVKVTWVRAENRNIFGEAVVPHFARRHAAQPFDVVEGPEYHADAREICPPVRSIPLVVKTHTPTIVLRELDGETPYSWTEGLRDRWAKLRVQLGGLRRGQKIQVGKTTTDFRREVLELYGIEREHARSADIVACPCLDLVEFCATRWDVDRAKIRHVPYPYRPRPELLAIPATTNTRVIGFLGRLERRKGIEDLALAVPEILKAVPEARFRFIGRPLELPDGKGPADAYLRNFLGPLASRVDFTGPLTLDQIPAELAGLDVCVFPSIWENFPNVCLEAMSAARGIVGSRAGGMSEMLADGAGMLVPPKDPAAIAKAAIHLLRNPAERIKMGEKARQRLQEEYNGDRIGNLMESVYREAIEIRRVQSVR